MPAKASTRLPPSDAMNAASGTSRAPNTGSARLRASSDDVRRGALADHDQRLRAIELRAERRAQRPGRNDPAVADAAPGIDHQHGKILGQRRVLEAVVHDDDAGAGRDRRLRALHAVARNDGRRGARQQQRLVADVGGAMLRRIDPHRAGEPPAIAAGEEHRPSRRRPASIARHRQRGRRLAGAADGRIADADDRHAGASRRCAPADARRPRRRSPRSAPASRPRAPLCRHQNGGSRMAARGAPAGSA